MSQYQSLCFAGRLSREKGVDVLLEAFARVLPSVPNARLIVAGDGPERKSLDTKIIKLGIAQSVEMLGQLSREDVAIKLGSAWLLSRPIILMEEPFGLSVAEAQMRGTAVIATASGGHLQTVVHGVTGILLPPADVDALCSALAKMLSNRSLAESMGAEARKGQPIRMPKTIS